MLRLFPRQLGSFQVNLDAALERRNDPTISSKADPLDIGFFAHIRRSLLGVTPLGRQGTQRDLAGLGSHVCSEHFLFSRPSSDVPPCSLDDIPVSQRRQCDKSGQRAAGDPAHRNREMSAHKRERESMSRSVRSDRVSEELSGLALKRRAARAFVDGWSGLSRRWSGGGYPILRRVRNGAAGLFLVQAPESRRPARAYSSTRRPIGYSHG
jgi:hypothetical protein